MFLKRLLRYTHGQGTAAWTTAIVTISNPGQGKMLPLILVFRSCVGVGIAVVVVVAVEFAIAVVVVVGGASSSLFEM